MLLNEPFPHLRFPLRILQTLEQIEAPYMLIGAFAGTMFGITRMTYDIDMVVDLQEAHILALATQYPLPRYYADPYQMRNAHQIGSKFNIIDTEEGERADLLPITAVPRYQTAFQNRIRHILELASDQNLSIWCARPEDIILGKLMAWEEGRARRHETDIFEILVSHKQTSGLFLDEAYVTQQVQLIGRNASTLWRKIQESI